MFWLLVGLSVAACFDARPPSPRFCDRTLFVDGPPTKATKEYKSTEASTATLTASPSVVDVDGTAFLHWSNVTNAASLDWVAVYCDESLGATATNVLDWHRVPVVGPTGQTFFPGLLNMRCKYFFRYYQDVSVNGETTYKLVAESNRVSVRGGNTTPQYGRLSLTGDLSEMDITWTTGGKAAGEVQYGTNPEVLPHHATATGPPKTYQATDMCNAPATEVAQTQWRNPGYQHTVRMTGLQPNTLYFYKYGNEGSYSDVQYFWSAPNIGPDQTVNFLAYGDMGTYKAPRSVDTAERCFNEVKTGARIVGNEGNYGFLLHFGDISYAWGLGYIWERFHYLIEPYATKLPYMASIGNHEYDYTSGGQHDPSGAGSATQPGFKPTWGNYGDDSNGECAVPMYNRFRTPNNGHSLFWYSFNYGNIHIVQFSTEHNMTEGSHQYEWIKNDLASVNRSATPWVIVTGHRPAYNSENYPSDYKVSTHIRAALDPLLYKYQVDLFLAGHYHSWERTCPVYNGQCDPKGTLHITVGSAGQSLDDASYMKEPWKVYGEYNYGYMRATANRTTLVAQYVVTEDGTVHDEFVLSAKF